MKEIKLITPEKESEYGVFIVYCQIKCRKCGRVWGYYMPDGEPLPERQLVCMKCAADSNYEQTHK
jgi:hypothetical protein